MLVASGGSFFNSISVVFYLDISFPIVSLVVERLVVNDCVAQRGETGTGPITASVTSTEADLGVNLLAQALAQKLANSF